MRKRKWRNVRFSFFISLEFCCPFSPTLLLLCNSASRLCSLAPWPALNRWGMFGTTLWLAVRLNWARGTSLHTHTHTHTHTYITYIHTHPPSSLFTLFFPFWKSQLSLTLYPWVRLECAWGLSPGLADSLLDPPNDKNNNIQHTSHWYSDISHNVGWPC